MKVIGLHKPNQLQFFVSPGSSRLPPGADNGAHSRFDWKSQRTSHHLNGGKRMVCARLHDCPLSGQILIILILALYDALLSTKSTILKSGT